MGFSLSILYGLTTCMSSLHKSPSGKESPPPYGLPALYIVLSLLYRVVQNQLLDPLDISRKATSDQIYKHAGGFSIVARIEVSFLL